jgi:RNA polymerase sigma-70 factor (ECF subfamily)
MGNTSQNPRDLDAEFAALMAANGASVRAFVSTLLPRAEDRDDVVQETHLALWAGRVKYDRTRPFTKWACGVAYRQVLQRRRQLGQNRVYFSNDAVELLSTDMMDGLDSFEERGEALERCLQALQPRDRGLVEARYRDGTPVASIAHEYRLTESALYKSLQRVREMLRDCVRRTVRHEQ